MPDGSATFSGPWSVLLIAYYEHLKVQLVPRNILWILECVRRIAKSEISRNAEFMVSFCIL